MKKLGNKTQNKPLHLSIETLRKLSDVELTAAAGGRPVPYSKSCEETDCCE